MWIFSQIQSNENIGLAKFSPSADSSDPSVTSFNPTLHFWIRKLYLRQIKLLKIKIYIPKICLYTDNMIEGIWQATAYWAGNSGFYLWKEQDEPLYFSFSVAKATLQSQMSVCPFVHLSSKPPSTLILHLSIFFLHLLTIIFQLSSFIFQPSSFISRLLSFSACFFAYLHE